MAILLGRIGSRRVLFALAMSACLARYSLAGGVAADNSSSKTTAKTQPSTEIYDVKTKEIPAPISPAVTPSASKSANSSDIPPPDFREFEDDKFINNLVGDDGKHVPKPDAKAAPAKEVVPEKIDSKGEPAPKTVDKTTPAASLAASKDSKEPVKDAAVAPKISDDVSKTEETAVPKDDSKAVAAPENPIAPAVPTAADAPKTITPAPDEKKTETPSATNITEGGLPEVPAAPAGDKVADSKSANQELSEADKQSYDELKKHLLNFIASSKVAKAGSSEDKKVEDTAKAGEESKPSEVAGAESKPEGAKKPGSSDDFKDFLEPDKKPDTKSVGEKSPDEKESEKKVAEAPAVAPVAAPIAKTPVTTEIQNEAAADTKSVDVVKPLPPKKFAEEKLERLDVDKPEEKEKLSEADKAYLKLLDKQRDALPDSKKLSSASIDTIQGISSALTPAKKGAKKETQYIRVEHGNLGEKGLEEDGVTKSQNKMDISVRKIGKNEDFEKSKVKLEKAYKALLVGQIAASISIYKDVLEKEPQNKDALFGLATAYHKNSQYEQAREIYTKILKKNPGDKEALNNFLVLVAEEAPEDALIELEKLERINSDFSPIAAQIAMIHLRLGDSEKAARYLRRAILLSPDNISYKYNLAVVYDKAGKQEQALQLYRQVVDAAGTGVVVPGSVDKITERMGYLEGKIAEKK